MYEEKTAAQIKAEVLAGMGNDLDKREGSFADDVAGPVALEIAKAYQALDRVLPIVYLDESSGEYIEKQAAWYGITRRPGATAKGQVTITGRAGARVPAGTVFLTADGLEFLAAQTCVLPAQGSAVLPVEAKAPGSAYNVSAGEIVRQMGSLPGVTGVENSAPCTGGADPEGDAALLARLQARRKRPATSGNAWHYRQWALESEGVGDAKITPLQNGPGTVGVLLVGMDRGPVDAAIVSACAAHIETQRPIGATVTVASAQALAVEVSAQITLDGTAELSQVKADYTARLAEYLKSISFERYEVLLSRVACLLLGTNGVSDYSALTLGGAAANLPVGPTQVPVLGEVTLTL